MSPMQWPAMDAGARWRAAAWLALAMLTTGCDLIPPLHVPQVQNAQRVVREPREERTRTYHQCSQEALRTPGGDPDKLVACMEAAGFSFLPQSAEHRRSHCITALETPGVLPDAFCFQKRP